MSVNNKNLSENEKNDAMKSAMNVLAKLGIKVAPETETLMQNFLDGEISQKEEMKLASQKKEDKKE